jgi:hypothetical protein
MSSAAKKRSGLVFPQRWKRLEGGEGKIVDVPFFSEQRIANMAVKEDPLNLEYVAPEHQNDFMIDGALVRDGLALAFVVKPKPYQRMMALQTNGLAIHYIDDYTPEEALASVLQCGMALDLCVRNPDAWNALSEKHKSVICTKAVEQNPKARVFVPRGVKI